MITTPLSEIAEYIGATMIGDDVDVSKVFIDSRNKDDPEGLFVALKGPHFDAHHFVNDVLKSGASGVLVDHPCDVNAPQIVVSNTRTALADIARLNRNKSSAKYIAITGSSGKTTVKEMVASILQLSGKTFATKGNLNNDIGVPLTLLDIDQYIEFGVVELGANHAGEIAYTADLTCPDVALVNNVAAAHLEGFGDLHGVANAKAEIYSALKKEGVAILNLDDNFYSFFSKKISVKQICFSLKTNADVMAKNIQQNEDQSSSFELHYQQKKIQINLSVIGLHNISNALAAASCCIAIGIPLAQIVEGLQNTSVVSGRLMVTKLQSGCRVIDDTYNANVASMKAAIDLLKNYTSPRILVLGDMAELGESGRECHEKIGEYAKKAGIDKLYTCGVLTQFLQTAFNDDFFDHLKDAHSKNKQNFQNHEVDKGEHFSQQHELVQKLKKEAIAGATILIKGSRSTHMENIVQALMEDRMIENRHQKSFSTMEKSAASLQGEK